MDPNEIIKAAPEIAKGAAALGAAIPFTGIVKRMLGPAADEVAEMWRDQVRLYRYERQLKCVEKAERMARDAGFTPQAVPPKILFPLLDGASLEEHEGLHDMWAALLANAASPENAGKFRPNFVVILRQLDPHEALILSRIHENHEIPVTNENEFRRFGLDLSNLAETMTEPHMIPRTFECAFKEQLRISARAVTDVWLSLEALMAQQLVEKTYWKDEGRGVFTALEVSPLGQGDYTFRLTHRGNAFIEACRPPKRKK